MVAHSAKRLFFIRNNFFGYPQDIFNNVWSFNIIGFPVWLRSRDAAAEITSLDLPRGPGRS